MKMLEKPTKTASCPSRAELAKLSRYLSHSLTKSGKIEAIFHPHFADIVTGEAGAEDLIERIIKANGEPMLSADIIRSFRKQTGNDAKRYSANSISQFLTKMKKSGKLIALRCYTPGKIGAPCKKFGIAKIRPLPQA
jgi:hypothetical protein